MQYSYWNHVSWIISTLPNSWFSQMIYSILCSLPHNFQHLYIDFRTIVLSCFHQLFIISCKISSFFTISASSSPYLIALVTLPAIMESLLLPRTCGWCATSLLHASSYHHCWSHHSSNTSLLFVAYAGWGFVFCSCSCAKFIEYFRQLFSPCPVKYFLLVIKK